MKFPNAGFPPIRISENEKDNDNQKTPDKGYFYSLKINNINIRDIFLEKKKSTNENIQDEDNIDIVDNI